MSSCSLPTVTNPLENDEEIQNTADMSNLLLSKQKMQDLSYNLSSIGNETIVSSTTYSYKPAIAAISAADTPNYESLFPSPSLSPKLYSSNYTIDSTHSSYFPVSTTPESPTMSYTPSSEGGPAAIVLSKNSPTERTKLKDRSFKRIIKTKPKLNISKHDYYTNIRYKIPYYIPILRWLPKYSTNDLYGDFIAGLTVGVMMMAQGLAYATLAGRPAIVGLYTAFFPVLIYVIFGTSGQVSFGPEVIISTLFGNAIAELELSDSNYEDTVKVLCFGVGLMVLIFGLLRIGYVEAILSQSVVSSLISAIAIGVVIEQSRSLLGVHNRIPLNDTTSISVLQFMIESLHDGDYNGYTILVSSVTIIVLVLLDKIKFFFNNFKWVSSIPSILIVIVLAILISYGLDLSQYNISILGHVESGFSTPTLPNFLNVTYGTIIAPIFTIAILNFVLTFVIVKKYALAHSYNVSPNRELVAIGLSNLIGSFFGTIPASGGLCRSKVNDSAGAKTPFSQLISAIIVLFAICFLMPLISTLPKCVIASIVVVAVVPLIDFYEPLNLFELALYQDLLLYLLIFLCTLIFGPDMSIIIAFGASLAILLKNVTVVQPQLIVLGKILKSHLNKINNKLVRDQTNESNSSVIIKINPTEIVDNHIPPIATDEVVNDSSSIPISENIPIIVNTAEEISNAAIISVEETRSQLYNSNTLEKKTLKPLLSTSNSRRTQQLKSSIRRSYSDKLDNYEFVSMSAFSQAEPIKNVLILQLKGALHFANIGRIQVLFRRVYEYGDVILHHDDSIKGVLSHSQAPTIVLDTSHVPSIDGASLNLFIDILQNFVDKNIKIYLVGISEACFQLLILSERFRKISKNCIFPNFKAALENIETPESIGSGSFFSK